jgi:uncharacterized membrane protein YphA (DoxX/SURF4 family)
LHRAIVLIRLLVGWVFVSEGIQKFLFPAALGVGRFARIGISHPASPRLWWEQWRSPAVWR